MNSGYIIYIIRRAPGGLFAVKRGFIRSPEFIEMRALTLKTKICNLRHLDFRLSTLDLRPFDLSTLDLRP